MIGRTCVALLFTVLVLHGARASMSQRCEIVAHAGGAYEGRTYVNSHAAILNSYRMGIRLFELDFAPTAGDEWLCLHDIYPRASDFRGRFTSLLDRAIFQVPSRWLDHYELVRGFLPSPTKAEREGICSARTTVALIRSLGAAKLITDTKYWNPRLLRHLAAQDKSVVIPQVYSKQEYELAKSLGFPQIILTLYKAKTFYDVAAVAGDSAFFALVIPAQWLYLPPSDSLSPRRNLADYRGKLYVHTVDDIASLPKDLPIDGIYSDRLVPASVKGPCTVATR